MFLSLGPEPSGGRMEVQQPGRDPNLPLLGPVTLGDLLLDLLELQFSSL